MAYSMFTITESAKQCGLTRAAIHKAIKTGRLSATKNDDGNYQIDPAELFRVYKKVDITGIQQNTEVDKSEYRLIAQRLEFTERLLKQAEEERDNLRLSLNQAMTLIAHQPAQPVPEPETVRSLLFERLFNRGRR
jgi:hypothetical protein